MPTIKKRAWASVYLLSVLVLFVSACGGSGSTNSSTSSSPSSTSDSSSSAPPEPNVTFTLGTNSFRIGQVVTLNIQQMAIHTLSATLNDEPLTLEIQQEHALFLMPAMPLGEALLRLNDGEQSVELSLTVEDTVLPGTPDAYLTESLDNVEAYLNSALSETMPQEERDFLEQLLAQISEQRSNLANLDETEKRAQARIIVANDLLSTLNEIDSGMNTQSPFLASMNYHATNLDLTACMNDAERYPGEFILAIASGATLVATLFPPTPAAILAAAVFYKALKNVTQRVDNVAENCIGPFGNLFLETPNESVVQSMQSATNTGIPRRLVAAQPIASSLNSSKSEVVFYHDRPSLFVVKQQEQLAPMIGSDFVGYIGWFQEMGERLNQALSQFNTGLNNLLSRITGFAAEDEQQLDPNTVNLVHISDPRIDGRISSEGELLELTFWFINTEEMPENPVAFQFQLHVIAGDQPPTEIATTLNPIAAPITFEQYIEVGENNAYTGILQALFADQIAIARGPFNGQADILDPITGAFRYEPNENFSGEDTFDFVASNAYGDSEPTRVVITVVEDVCQYSSGTFGDHFQRTYICTSLRDYGTFETYESYQRYTDGREAFSYTEAQRNSLREFLSHQEVGITISGQGSSIFAADHQYQLVTASVNSSIPLPIMLQKLSGSYTSSGNSHYGVEGPVAGVGIPYTTTYTNCIDDEDLYRHTFSSTIYELDGRFALTSFDAESATYTDITAGQCRSESNVRAIVPSRFWDTLDNRTNWMVYQKYLQGE